MNPQEVFDQMAANLNADAAKGMNSTIQFNLSGDGGGEWYVAIKDGKAEVSKGKAPARRTVCARSANASSSKDCAISGRAARTWATRAASASCCCAGQRGGNRSIA